MKTVLLTITLAITSFFLTAQTSVENTSKTISEGTTITVTVTLSGSGGHIMYGLHNESTFMKTPLKGFIGDINDGKSTYTFENVVPGTYAIVVMHDKNDNKLMDFQPNGMPKEAYGMSNNPINMGPPQWKDAKFEVSTTPLTMEIRL